VAHPILEKYEVPATLYVATRFISSNFLIWTDELERIIVGNSFTMPKKLQLSAEVLIDFSSSKSKMLSLKSAKKFLKTLPPKERDFLINDLAARLHGKHDLYQNSQLHDFLDWEQVRFLKNSTLWEIGAHTLSHNSLGTLSKFDGEMEILESMQQVCGEVGVTFPPLFAYPEGQNFDIPIYAVDILQGSGLSTAPSAISGTNQLPFDSRDGFYRLRRYLVGFENIEFPWQL
jgi:peptidoglycan/xylan/chitin deacetylase (PgdA/CDA1 family)